MDNIDRLPERLDALEHHIQTLHQQTRTTTRQLRWWRLLACALAGLAVLSWALPSGTAQETLEQRVATLEAKLAKLTFDNAANEIVISGANLRIVNGMGMTSCTGNDGQPIPGCLSGLGNLIVGYNEPRDGFENIRIGSHNVVVGRQHNFSRVGGLVVSESNEISGDFAVVSGGFRNTANGLWSSVSGGTNNIVSANEGMGTACWIGGGEQNEAK